MTTVEATVAVIEAEGLDRFRDVIGDGHANEMDALVLTERDRVWTSFFTSERAAVMTTSIRTYENLSDALDGFLRLMRQRAELEVLMTLVTDSNRIAHEEWRELQG